MCVCDVALDECVNLDVPRFRVTGYVSSSEHGKGRGSSDRQFYFINQRPCDFSKVRFTLLASGVTFLEMDSALQATTQQGGCTAKQSCVYKPSTPA